MNEQQQRVLDETMGIYIKWVNSFVEATEPDLQMSRADFTDDRDNGHYGHERLELHHPNDYNHVDLYVYEVYDGDDGGPATLFVWYDTFNNEVQRIVQLFDTTTSNVYESPTNHGG